MVEFINEEVYLFFESIMLGAVLSFIYDWLRIFRRIIPRGKLITGIEDILFFLGASVTSFILLYMNNGGIIRWYVIVGLLSGSILYYLSIGQFFVKYTTRLIKKMISILTAPIRFVYSYIKRMIKIFTKVLKKTLKPIKIKYKNIVEKEDRKSRKKSDKSIRGNKNDKKRKNKQKNSKKKKL